MPISQRRKCLFDGDWRVIGEPPEIYTLQLARWLKGFSVIKWCCKVHLQKGDRRSLRQHLFDGKLKCIVQPAVLQEIILSTLLKSLMNDWKLLMYYAETCHIIIALICPISVRFPMKSNEMNVSKCHSFCLSKWPKKTTRVPYRYREFLLIQSKWVELKYSLR